MTRASSKPRDAKPKKPGRSAEPDDLWTLRLYIAGDSPKSRPALANLQRLCDTHLEGKYKLEVIDLKTRPELAKADQIRAPPPRRPRSASCAGAWK